MKRKSTRRADPDAPQPPGSVQKHDRIFRSTFSVRSIARQFFETWLPPELLKSIRWTTLKRSEISGVDESLAERREDVLYEVQIAGQKVCLYILLEHQTRPDRLMPLRVLEQTLLIWKSYRKAAGSGALLPMVIPFVVYLDTAPWNFPKTLRPMVDVPEALAGWQPQIVPDPGFVLLELGKLPMEQLANGAAARAVLAALQMERKGTLSAEQVTAVLREFLTEEQSREIVEVANKLWTYLLYCSDLQKEEVTAIVDATIKPEPRKEYFMSTAERLRQEGRMEGRMEGLEEGMECGEWIGKVRVLEQLMGREQTPSQELAKLRLRQLQSRYQKLEKEYHGKYRR